MRKFNLLGSPEKLYRDTKLRKGNKLQNKRDALKFGLNILMACAGVWWLHIRWKMGPSSSKTD